MSDELDFEALKYKWARICDERCTYEEHRDIHALIVEVERLRDLVPTQTMSEAAQALTREVAAGVPFDHPFMRDAIDKLCRAVQDLDTKD